VTIGSFRACAAPSRRGRVREQPPPPANLLDRPVLLLHLIPSFVGPPSYAVGLDGGGIRTEMLDCMKRRCAKKAAKKLLAGGWGLRIAAIFAMFALMYGGQSALGPARRD
jgi:hypothetical protein